MKKRYGKVSTASCLLPFLSTILTFLLGVVRQSESKTTCGIAVSSD